MSVPLPVSSRLHRLGTRSRAVAVVTASVVASWAFAASPAQASVTYPVKSVTVGQLAVGIAVDPVTHQVFVANETDGTVSAISEATDAVTTIPLPLPQGSPIGVAVDVTHSLPIQNNAVTLNGAIVPPVGIETSAVYVLYLAGSVSVINPATDAVTATIALPVGHALATAIAIDASTHTA